MPKKHDYTAEELAEGVANNKNTPTSKSALELVQKRMHRVRVRLAHANDVEITDDQLNERIKTRILEIIETMDHYSLATAKLSELSSAFKTLFEAKQLLDGKPTQIMSRQDRVELDILLPKLVREARRRGVPVRTIDGQHIEGTGTEQNPKYREIEDLEPLEEDPLVLATPAERMRSLVPRSGAGQPPPKKKPPKTPRRGFPKGTTKAYFDRNGYEWPGLESDPATTKWRDIDPEGF